MKNRKILFIPARLQMFVPAFVSEIKRMTPVRDENFKIVWFLEPALIREKAQIENYLSDFNVNYDIPIAGISFFKNGLVFVEESVDNLPWGAHQAFRVRRKFNHYKTFITQTVLKRFFQINVIRRLLRLYQLFLVLRLNSLHFRTYQDIRNYIEKENPAAVVVGSDQGGMAVLYALEACFKLKIPVFIYSICDIENKDAKLEFNHKICRFLNRFDSDYLSFVKATLYRGNIIGAYPRKSFITTVSPEFAKKIQERAQVPEHEVELVYPPAFEVSEKAKLELDEYLKQRPSYRPILSIYTENLIPIYGVNYWQTFCFELRQTLATLTDSFTIILKLHPDESEVGIQILQSALAGLDLCISKSFNTQYLIQSSALCVAHFSRVLIEAMQVGIPVASFNLKNDRTRSFISEDLTPGIELKSVPELLPLCLELKKFGKIQDEAYQFSYSSLQKRIFPSQDKSLLEYIDNKLSEIQT